MRAVLYRLLCGSKWGRSLRWDGTWWDGMRVVSHCGIPIYIPFPSHPILNRIPIPFVQIKWDSHPICSHASPWFFGCTPLWYGNQAVSCFLAIAQKGAPADLRGIWKSIVVCVGCCDFLPYIYVVNNLDGNEHVSTAGSTWWVVTSSSTGVVPAHIFSTTLQQEVKHRIMTTLCIYFEVRIAVCCAVE